MKITITIDMDNDAFWWRGDNELRRLLLEAADIGERLMEAEESGWSSLRDINGNTVGEVQLDA